MCLCVVLQISKALLGDDQRLWLPRFLDDEQAAKDPEQTKQVQAAALSDGTNLSA